MVQPDDPLSSNKPLPSCDGPKLHPFRHRKLPVSFVGLLSDKDSNGHAHVFDVTIGNKPYALKVFKFYDDEEDRAGLIGSENEYVSDGLLRNHSDPFYAECRAYGRLIEHKRNGRYAVRCHGFMKIAAQREEELAREFKVESWDRPDEEYDKDASSRQPFRAVVKDLVSTRVPFTERFVKKALSDLKNIRKLGIYPIDITARNYVGGLLVDFSIALTSPHYLFDVRPKFDVEEDLQQQDLIFFDKMVEERGNFTWARARRNLDYCEKLRSSERN